MKITLFTPCYNRGPFLDNIYKSLCNQTCKDFEWIVVDDGSTDNTETVMESIIAKHDKPFSIHFFIKKNGGKHSAFNLGVAKAQGELFFPLDSDDSLPSDSIKTVIEQYLDVADNEKICGVSGLMAHHNGKQIGSGYPTDVLLASSIDLRYKYGVTGDLIEVFKTSILRRFPFPEIEGERFCPEALVWNRIAQIYELKCFNQIVYYRDYLEDGLTDNIVRVRMKSPIASMMCYAEICKLQIPLWHKVKAAINYWRFRLCTKSGTQRNLLGLPWIWVLPFAYFMHKRDIKHCQKS